MPKRSRRAEAGSSSQAPPPEGPWSVYDITLTNPLHQQRFIALEKRKVQCTKWFDQQILKKMGIYEDVLFLAKRVGFEKFIRLPPYGTSRRLTLEFLATLELNTVQEQGGGSHKAITFQLMNRQFTQTLPQLNRMFRWDHNAPTLLDLNEFAERKKQDPTLEPEWFDLSNTDDQDVWLTFTNDDWFEARKAKSSRLIHPAVRYLHRLLVYSVWGRTELGAMHAFDIEPLRLMTVDRDMDRPFPINYAEKFIQRMLEMREGRAQRSELVMGGLVTRMTCKLITGFDQIQVDHVQPDTLLDERMLTSVNKWLAFVQRSDRMTWYVGVAEKNVPWLDLPTPELTRIEGCDRPNPFKLPHVHAGEIPPPIPPVERVARRATPPPPPPQIHTTTAPDYQSLMDSMSQMRLDQQTFHHRQLQETDYQTTYLRGIYASQVEAGNIRHPYLNYPHHPPQQGPVPGWHGGYPTYPYWPYRPGSPDYRYPGGSDPAYDPNFPPFDTYPAYPPDFFSSMPAMQDTWGSAPLPPYVVNLLREPPLPPPIPPASSSQPPPQPTEMETDEED